MFWRLAIVICVLIVKLCKSSRSRRFDAGKVLGGSKHGDCRADSGIAALPEVEEAGVAGVAGVAGRRDSPKEHCIRCFTQGLQEGGPRSSHWTVYSETGSFQESRLWSLP